MKNETQESSLLVVVNPPANWSLRDFGATKHGEAKQLSLTPSGEASIDIVGDRERYTYRHGSWHRNRGNEIVVGDYATVLTVAWNTLLENTPIETQ